MSDQQVPARNTGVDDASAFEQLIGGSTTNAETGFTTVFRGYDRDEVDAAISRLTARLRADGDEIAFLEERYRRISETATAQNREVVQRLQDDLEARLEAAEKLTRETTERFQAELAEANSRAAKAEEQISDAAAAADERSRETVAQLQAEVTEAKARAAKAEQRAEAVTDELVGATTDSPNRPQFEEILRVAEEQASVIIRNASVQADRLLEAARGEILNRRKETQAEAEAILSQAQHDAQQARLRIETELTAHRAGVDREAAHAAEKVSQAEQEAAAIRTEAEKGAAALRSMVARETSLSRAEAEEAVRELRVRALEFEESLTRRQDDAQQEFLMLHNQAVAHAERITQDANDQVAASLDHATRMAAKADDFDRLMRAQAQQVEADASVRAREVLERARAKAEKIIDTVTTHSHSVLRDAEDRTRQLRWQQHQLTSFMLEVKELIRPETPLDAVDDTVQDAVDDTVQDAVDAGESAEQIDAELAELVDAERGEHTADDERAESADEAPADDQGDQGETSDTGGQSESAEEATVEA